MGKGTRNAIEIPADIKEFGTALTFAEGLLKRTPVSREIAYETMIIFEAVLEAVLAQGTDSNTTLNISAKNRLGSIYLIINYEGKRFTPLEEDANDMLIEFRLLEGYADKVSHSYRSGYNTIRISVHKSPRAYFLTCGAGALAAIVAHIIIGAVISPAEQQTLLNDYVFPFEQLYANAMLMVGAPVTFFSLMKNASDAVVISERILNARKLHIKSITTSIFAIALALGLGLALTLALSMQFGRDAVFSSKHVEWTFAEMVVSMVPASIFEPFEVISPIPLIVVALLVTYALVSAGRDFDVLKGAIDVCYRLFARMLSAVMASLPVASFLAILDVLLRGGSNTIVYALAFTLFAILSTCALFITYAIRLKAKGVKIASFIKKLLPLLRENGAIGSAIEAAPYNIRYCVKHFGMNRDRLSQILPLMAQINRDGNCFLLMFITVLYIFVSGTEISMVNIAVITAVVLFLSFGSPNQPGSILIGTLIIVVNYLNSYDMICMAIYLEVFLGGVQNMINVIGDIVIAAEEEGVRYEE